MLKTTQTLSRLMDYYQIVQLKHGAKEDKLGDVYEDYCINLLNSPSLLEKFNNNTLNLSNTDELVYHSILNKNIITYARKIYQLHATRNIPHRSTGGNPKTDIIAYIKTDTSNIQLPISVKQTTASKVAMAEFDVDTIVREIQITDNRLIELLTKHQIDASARNFTKEEKAELFQRLAPYRNNFVHWVLTGTPNSNTDDLRYPKLIVKFSLTKQDTLLSVHVYTIDEYLDHLMLDKNGQNKKGGFGTGLSWTYATGSKGRKIQFKG